MILHKEFETAADYVDWLNENLETALVSVVQQHIDGQWKTFVIYRSNVEIPTLRLQA